MNKIIVNIELPKFVGLYESQLLPSEAVGEEIRDLVDFYNEDEDEPLGMVFTEENFVFRIDSFKKDIAKAFADTWRDYKPSFVKSIKRATLWSPTDYSRATDKVYADVELKANWLETMQQFINDNRVWFADRIKKDWSSRPGFVSFMADNIDEWLVELPKCDARYISAMFEYMGEKAWSFEDLQDMLTWETGSKVCLADYVGLDAKTQRKVNKKRKALGYV